MPELVPSWVPEAGMFFVIGVSGWWSENAMQWAESPIFVEKTPEKAAIGNLLSVACACGNIFPFVYTKLLPSDTQTKILPAVVIICQAIAVIAALGVGFGWQETITVGGTEYSYLLLGGTFLAAGVGTLSNVTYWALALRCDGVHATKSMSVGMTVGGLVVTWAATLWQQAGAQPRFSVLVFMSVVGVTQMLFLGSLVIVLRRPDPTTPRSRPKLRQRTVSTHFAEADISKADLSVDMSVEVSVGSTKGKKSSLKEGLLDEADAKGGADRGDRADMQSARGGLDASYLSVQDAEAGPPPSKTMKNVILCTMFVVYALTYSLPSLGPYMVQSFHHDHAGRLLSLMNGSQQAGDVAGRLATAIPWIPQPWVLGLMVGTLVLLSSMFVTAAIEPVCGLLGEGASFLLPMLFFTYFFIRGFVVTVMYVWVKGQTTKKQAALLTIQMGWYGQCGAMVGPLLQLVLVQFFNVFHLRVDGSNGGANDSCAALEG